MASIYESRDPAVELRGPQQAVPFQPVQAFDPSRAVLAEDERRINQSTRAANTFFQNQSNDLEALSKFSETLSKFMVSKAEEKNKADYLRGLTRMSLGKATLNPKIYDSHKQGEIVLKQEAESEIKVANQISQQNPAAGASYFNQAPAVSGWEAYGMAVRQAQLAAGDSQAFFSQYRRRNDPASAISISRPDGSVRTFTPAQAETEEEVAAVMAAGTSEFLRVSGLEGLNPAVIAEHVLPRLDEARGTIAVNWTKEIFANAREDKLAAIDTHASRTLPTANSQQAVQDLVAKTFDDAFTATGSRREANELAQKILFDVAQSLSRVDPTKADELREWLSTSLVNPAKPELGTLGERFETEFDTLNKLIVDTDKEKQLVEAEDTKRRVEDALSTHQAVQQTGNLREAQRSFDAAEKFLIDLSKTKPKEAAEGLIVLRGRQRNYSVATEKSLLEAIKDPDELSALLVQGYISQEGYNSKKDELPTSGGKAKVSDLSGSLTGFFTELLAKEANLKGLDPDGTRRLVTPIAQQLVNELLVYGYDLEAQARASGQARTQASLRDELMRRGQDMLKNNARFQVEVEDGVIKTNLAATKYIGSTVSVTKGPSLQVLSNRAINRLPAVASALTTLGLDKPQVESNVKAIAAGGRADERVRVLAAAANVSELDYLKAQAKPYGIDTGNLDTSRAAEVYKANSALDPTAARILANPRSSNLQRSAARSALERAKNRQTYQQDYSDGKAFVDLRTAIVQREGGAQGYNAANRGSAGDTPNGVPNLTSMTIQQVLSLYDQGGYNVLGGYQFKKTTLQNLIRDTGLSLTTKFTPEVQDQLFESYFNRGSNNRKRLSDYVNGRSTDLRGAVEDLSLEFAAVRSLNGRGQYDGTSGNRASLDASQLLRQIREERIGRGRPVDMSSRNIQSIRIETPGRSFQPGFDLWFADKRFGSVLPGTVKEIRRNAGNYGNMVIVESIDPATNQPVDVVYSHLASISVAPGQRVRPGQMVGVQGGTGRVVSQDGTIASVDFLTPAPRGSNSMKPYQYWRELTERLKNSIESNRSL